MTVELRQGPPSHQDFVSQTQARSRFITGAKAETFSRAGADPAGTLTIVSGTLYLMAIPLIVGTVVTTISFRSRNTALAVGVNQWFSLWDSARAKLGVTNDDTSTAWGTNTTKTLTLTSPYTVLSTGLYYVGLVVVAATPPTLASVGYSNISAPILSGSSNTGLTDPASAPATADALSASSAQPFAYVS